jgi:hypothetical protein
MHDLVSAVTNVSYIAVWVLMGPPCAVLLFHMGEKRWGNGPTWAFLGFCFNIFALIMYGLLAGYESNEASSIGAYESQRVQKVVRAIKGDNAFARNLLHNTELNPRQPLEDRKLRHLLDSHHVAEALSHARERYHVAFQAGDGAAETYYRDHIDRIETEDASRRANIASLQGHA